MPSRLKPFVTQDDNTCAATGNSRSPLGGAHTVQLRVRDLMMVKGKQTTAAAPFQIFTCSAHQVLRRFYVELEDSRNKLGGCQALDGVQFLCFQHFDLATT